MSLENKVVVITGAANGIGKAIAYKFAERGAHSVIVDINKYDGRRCADEISITYKEAMYIEADVTEYESMMNVREKVVSNFHRVDILVLNAGVSISKNFGETTKDDWNRVVDINMTGLFNTVKAFYGDFLTNKGAIVYVSSASVLSGTGGGAAYPASKSGGDGLMRGLAKELGPRGVNVNIVAPRLIVSGDTIEANYPTKESLDKVLEEVPIGRLGKPDDVANAVCFLADPVNSYIHGQTLILDGGRTMR